MRCLLYLFLVFVFCSCGYRTITETASNGDITVYRKYKNPAKDKKYGRFNQYTLIRNSHEYPKFSGTPICDSSNGKVYVQYDSSSRIYLKLTGDSFDFKYLPLFTSGLLYPKSILCSYDSLCRPIRDYCEERVREKDTLKYTRIYMGQYFQKINTLKSDTLYTVTVPCNRRFGWEGNAMHFYNPKELFEMEKSKKIKVFSFSILQEDIWTYEEYKFMLFVKNENAYENEDLKSFCAGADVSEIIFEGGSVWN